MFGFGRTWADPGKLFLQPVDPVLQRHHRIVDVLALLRQALDLELELVQGLPHLGALVVVHAIKVKDLSNIRQGQANALSLEDQLQPGPVTVAVNAGHAVPCRVQHVLVLVEAQGPRRYAEFPRQFRDRVRP